MSPHGPAPTMQQRVEKFSTFNRTNPQKPANRQRSEDRSVNAGHDPRRADFTRSHISGLPESSMLFCGALRLIEKPNSLASFFEQISGTELAIENALGSASTDREPLRGLKRWTSLHPGQFASFDSLARGLGWNTVIRV